MTCFEQALTALWHLPEQHHTQEQAIDLCDDLGNALQALGAFERHLASSARPKRSPRCWTTNGGLDKSAPI